MKLFLAQATLEELVRLHGLASLLQVCAPPWSNALTTCRLVRLLELFLCSVYKLLCSVYKLLCFKSHPKHTCYLRGGERERERASLSLSLSLSLVLCLLGILVTLMSDHLGGTQGWLTDDMSQPRRMT